MALWLCLFMVKTNTLKIKVLLQIKKKNEINRSFLLL